MQTYRTDTHGVPSRGNAPNAAGLRSASGRSHEKAHGRRAKRERSPSPEPNAPSGRIREKGHFLVAKKVTFLYCNDTDSLFAE